MKYNFDTIIDRTVTDCEKYRNNEAIFGTSDVLPLWIADMDFSSGDFIINALEKRVSHGVLGYTCRCDSFWSAIQSWLERRSGWYVEKEWLEFSPGVVSGVVFALLSNSSEGDGILIQPPVYHPFANVINQNNRRVVNNPLVQSSDGSYHIDFEDFEVKLRESKVFILCNPHNPTGRVFTADELRRMGELCVKHGVVIVADEIHMDFVFRPHTHTHIAALSSDLAQNTITLTAPSKSFNIAGLCTAYAIIPNKELLAKYREQMQCIHCDNANVFGIIALKAAYTHGEQWMEEVLEYLEANIDYVIDFLQTNLPSVQCVKPEATFLLWFDFREWGLSQKELNDFLVKDAKLGLNCGSIYGIEGVGFERINIGAPRSVIERAMNQLLAAAKAKGLA